LCLVEFRKPDDQQPPPEAIATMTATCPDRIKIKDTVSPRVHP
jgi:hypothetical protein